jgi:hypothetical protein
MDHASARAGVLIPTFQSLISGLLAGLVVLAGSLVWGYSSGWALLAGAVVACWSWLLLLGRWHRIAAHLAGIKEPEPVERPNPSDVVRVELISDNGHSWQFADLPTDRERLEKLARGVVQGTGLSEGVWTGSQGPYSLAEFRALRAELIKRGVVRWVNPRSHNQGVVPSPAGLRVFAHIAQAPVGDLRTRTHARGLQSTRTIQGFMLDSRAFSIKEKAPRC